MRRIVTDTFVLSIKLRPFVFSIISGFRITATGGVRNDKDAGIMKKRPSDGTVSKRSGFRRDQSETAGVALGFVDHGAEA